MPEPRVIAKATSRKGKGKKDAVVTSEKAQDNVQAANTADNDIGVAKVVAMSEKAKGKQKVVGAAEGGEKDVVMSEDAVVMSETPIVMSEIAKGEQKAKDTTQEGIDMDPIKGYRPISKYSAKKVASTAYGVDTFGDGFAEGSLAVAMHFDNGAKFEETLRKYAKLSLLEKDQDGLCKLIEKGTHEQIMRVLRTFKANLDAPHGEGGSALAAAAKKGDEQLVNAFLHRGCSLKLGYTRGGGDALHAAAAAGESMILELLLRKAMPVNVRGGEFGYPLQAAMCSNKPLRDVMCVSLLLAAGADVNARGGTYGTALQAAVARGRPILVKMILETKGVYVDIIEEAQTAAEERAAALSGRDKEIAVKIVDLLRDGHGIVDPDEPARDSVGVDEDGTAASDKASNEASNSEWINVDEDHPEVSGQEDDDNEGGK